MWNLGAGRENKLKTILIYLFQTRQCLCQDPEQVLSENFSVQLKQTPDTNQPFFLPINVFPGMTAWLREMVGEYQSHDSLEIGSGLHLVQGMLCPTVLQADSSDNKNKAHH